MSNESSSDKRQHPRIQIELPVQVHGETERPLVLQMSDISAQGMQIKMTRSDFEALQKPGEKEGMSSFFEVQITARLSWVRPDVDEGLTTGWEFDFMEDEERIG